MPAFPPGSEDSDVLANTKSDYATDALLIDSHCHLDFDGLRERVPAVLDAMRDNGVAAAMCIGVNLEHIDNVLALSEAHDNLAATVGVHPEYESAEAPDVERLTLLAAHPRVVAIGETGLDYHWHQDKPEWQRERFRVHIRAACATNKALVIHTREAADDTLAIMAEEDAPSVGGVMHCFTGDWEEAKKALDLGFYISLSGIVTFKNARSVHEVAKRTPLDRLLVETDAPYLAPVPHRGQTNEPGWVRFVAERIASLRGLTFEAVASATTANYFNCFPGARRLPGLQKLAS